MLALLLAAAVAATTAAVAAATPAPDLAARRAKLEASLAPGDAIFVLATAPEGASEVGDPYRPDSDFWYLTGFEEPGAVAVLGGPDGYALFVRPADFTAEQWTGRRAGIDGAKARTGAKAVYPIADLDRKLAEYFKHAHTVPFRLGYSDGGDRAFRSRLLDLWAKAGEYASVVRPTADVRPLLHQHRLVKDQAEIAAMRRAAELSAKAHVAAMKVVRPDAFEYDVKAQLVKTCLEGGASRMAYPSIVGSGPNSVLLHYDKAERRMKAGEIIVNDTACELGLYAADITRSYPVSGKFSANQRAIYEIVLAAQKAGIEKIAPGVTYHEVYDTTVAVIVDGLLKLGILKGDRAEIVAKKSYKAFYPHGCCHWIGLNVHDPGSYDYGDTTDRYTRYATANAKLEAGMVLTVEPGVYIPEKAPGVDARWWNLGVRIEDDILVTKDGRECLSCAAPRELVDVEAALGQTPPTSRK